MDTPAHLSVLIVGAGPTGLMMAAECLRHRIAFRLIDKALEPSVYSKALVVHTRTQEVFADLGIIQEALDGGEAVQAIQMTIDGKPRFMLDLGRVDSPYPHGLVLEQSQTERILISHLQRQGKQVERGAELVACQQNDREVVATLRYQDGHQETSVYDWLVACDGASSTVRGILDLPFEGTSYEERFFLADLKVKWNRPPHKGFGFITGQRFGVVVPMKDGYYRLIGIVPPDFVPAHVAQDTPVSKQAPSFEELKLLTQAFIPEPITLYDPKWIAAFRSHCRLVSQFRVGRIFLAGDAAHIHSPAGGQGMNTGIQDAHNLGWKLAWVIHRGATDRILDTYHQERYPIAKTVLRFTDLAFRNISIKNGIYRWIRNLVMPTVFRIPFLVKKIQTAISGLNVAYPHSVLNVTEWEQGITGGPKAGQRAPDATLVAYAKDELRTCTLFSQIGKEKHTALVLIPTWNDLFFTPIQQGLAHMQPHDWIRWITVVGEAPPGHISERLWSVTLWDKEKHIHARYGATVHALFYIIRPDGYVAGRCLVVRGDTPLYLRLVETYHERVLGVC